MSFARVRALALVGLLVATAAVFVTIALIKDRQTGPTTTNECAQGAVIVNDTLPEEKQVNLNVYNATGKPGLAGDITSDFASRGFKATVQNAAPNPPANKPNEKVAILRFGPKAVGAAWLVRAYFLDKSTDEFDKNRQDDKVDVILGAKFQQLPTVTEVKQSIGALGNPELPEGTCAEA
ncbi:LytR C-terminal domain-containing protein [Dactylosporangium sp. NPDC049525]|uniref:LytR C-terminal domain-containing protein n=1 Tax=Dactylosporangium sp. NPDC049525 TaxID=3154730 RepID=UPI00343356AF